MKQEDLKLIVSISYLCILDNVDYKYIFSFSGKMTQMSRGGLLR